jgi:hypothetical protein
MTRVYNLQSLSADLQELDLAIDRNNPKVYRGYRGGFASMWYGIA